MTSKSLTVALPIHNGETYLQQCVDDMLELVSELTSEFTILIIDDGSTDDTWHVAEQLSTRFPQIKVMRHRHRRGLGPTLKAIKGRIRSDVVIVHDGVTPIDPVEVHSLWKTCLAERSGQRAATLGEALGVQNLTATHAAMFKAHERVQGFQLIRTHGDESESTTDDSASQSTETQTPTKPAPTSDTEGIGQIPTLPRPKFMSALAQFALGE